MDHHHPHRTRDQDHQSPAPFGGHEQHRFLDLDAEVFGDNLAAVLELTGVPAARGIVDLGAGTGAGSRLLRARYPDAAVTCVDNDPQMLDLLRGQGFAVLEADLDDGFPALAGTLITSDAVAASPLDLVWASSSLHHIAHPGRLLSGARRALAPGGVMVVVELGTLPRFLSHPREALLEQRCHAAAAAEGWNHHPDWTPAMQAAGFVVTKSEVATDAPVTPAAREYARQWFERFSHLAVLTADDRDAVEDLLERFGDNHFELEPSVTRTVWVATTPDRNQEQPSSFQTETPPPTRAPANAVVSSTQMSAS